MAKWNTLDLPKLQLEADALALQNEPTAEQVNTVIADEALELETAAKKETIDVALANTNPGSFERKQVEGLKSFFDAPVNVGALAGQALAGIFGGSAAGAAASPIAQEFQKLASTNYNAARDREVRRESIAQKNTVLASKGLNLKKTNVQDTRTGETLSYDSKTGKYLNENLDAVPSKFQKNMDFEKEDRLQEFGGTRIDQKYIDQALSRERFNDKRGEDAERKKATIIKMVEANPVYKKSQEALSEVDTIKNLLDDAYSKGGQSLAMLGPKIAKGIAGEVGVLTEQDVTRYVKNPSLVGGLMDTLAKMKSGKITGESKENIERLLDIMSKESLRRQENVINNVTSRYSKITKDFTEKDAKNIFSAPTSSTNKTPISKSISNMTKEERDARMKALREKAGK